MARISFTSTAAEIVGRLAGSVFQDSNCGYQVRGLVTPRNPQTQLQQLRRGDFRYLSSGWRFLTSIEQGTWITEAGTIPEALRLFIGNNINLNLIGEDIVYTFVPGTTPGTFPLMITEVSDSTFFIQASTGTTIVPAGQQLLLYSTFDNSVSALFNNPAAYQPIAVFPAGIDFAGPIDVYTDWTAHYGVLRLNRHICIKTVLIDNSNGNRGGEEINCAMSAPPVTNYLINSDGTFIIDSDGTFIASI